MLSSFVLAVLGAAAVSAQTTSTSVSVYPPVDPDNVPESTRIAWCNGQLSVCPPICLNMEAGAPEGGHNTCDPTDFSYTCICGNGQTPNASEYSETMPYYLCSEQVQLCIKNCGRDNICAENCKANKPCGAQNPRKPNKTTKASASATATDLSEATDTAAATETSDSSINLKGAANSLLAFGEAHSVVVLVTSFGFSIFAFL